MVLYVFKLSVREPSVVVPVGLVLLVIERHSADSEREFRALKYNRIMLFIDRHAIEVVDVTHADSARPSLARDLTTPTTRPERAREGLAR